MAFGITVAGASSAPMAASMTPQQTMHAMVGTWSCVTHDSAHKTWRETDVDMMWGPWIKIDSTFPAQNGQAAGTGVGFFRYDAQHGRLVVAFLDTIGNYSIGTSTSHSFNGAHWIDGYPADHGGALTHMTSSHEFTVDGTGPDSHGHTMTTHEVCTKV